MDKNANGTFLFLLLLMYFLFSGCPGDAVDPEITGGIQESDMVDVLASVKGNHVELSWDAPDDASGFSVYRQTGGGDFEKVREVQENTEGYTDDTCPVNLDLKYKILFGSARGDSFYSHESEALFIPFGATQTSGVSASKLETAGGIRVSWDAVSGIDSYKIYRFTSPGAEQEDAVFESNSNFYEDSGSHENGPLNGTPYFYKVSCLINSNEYSLSSSVGEGIFADYTDTSEPNNDSELADEIGETLETVYLYSYNNGEAQDIDWYKYTGSETFIRVHIVLPADSPLAGEVRLEIPNTNKSVVLTEGDNHLDYSGSGELYFFVFFDTVDPDLNDIAPYDVFIESLL